VKICKNCGCFDVCKFADQNRAEDCADWQPVITYCRECRSWEPEHCFRDQGWCSKVVGYRHGTWFCAAGARKDD
jgi:hypothetical protein